MELKRENTLRLNFGVGTNSPTDAELFDFFRKRKWKSQDLSAMYREGHFVFIRFNGKELFGKALRDVGNEFKFEFSNGKQQKVFVNDANVKCNYVRLFGLPPEVDNEDIETSMSKFGMVQQVTRERFSVDTGYPIWNGTIGVFMEINEEIPAAVMIRGFNVRVFYDGQPNKCFVCGSFDHLKVNCSQQKKKNNRLPLSSPNKGSSSESDLGSKVTQPVSELVVLHDEDHHGIEVVQKIVNTTNARKSNGVEIKKNITMKTELNTEEMDQEKPSNIDTEKNNSRARKKPVHKQFSAEELKDWWKRYKV